jgi:hypothetical protein
MFASLLYYRKFVKSLTDIDFVIDPCVANKRIEGKQMIIFFHADDCKLSHRKKTVINIMIEYLCQKYESISEDVSGAMTVSRGKLHKYLGMTLDYTVRGQVKITMYEYGNKISLLLIRQSQKAAARSQVQHPTAFSRSTKTARNLNKTRLWNSTTWW